MKVPTLLAITPGDGRELAPWVDALADGGLPGLLIREPSASSAALYELASRAVGRIPVVALHDRNPHARRVADTLGLPVHLPSGGDPHGLASFGVSAHSGDEVDRALERGARWVLLSPVWRPRSKPLDDREPLGLEGFMKVAAGRPVLALGGVDALRFARLRSRGAAGAAVIGALFDEADPAAAALALQRFLGPITSGLPGGTP